MRHGQGDWRAGRLGAGLVASVLAMAALGCHGGKQAVSSQEANAAAVETSSTLANKGAAVISAVCTRQSYATAKVGLIAGETGLREDVFELRDPVSYKVIPYRLGATVRLERLLRQASEATGRPKEQIECMRDFADHFKGLSDPLVQTAKDQKKIDVLAFKDAEKEAKQEVETEEQVEKNSR